MDVVLVLLYILLYILLLILFLILLFILLLLLCGVDQARVCTSTDNTPGKSRTIGSQLSPPLAEQ